MGGLPCTNESTFRIPVPAKISCQVTGKTMAEAVTSDMPSSDWLKVYLKIKPLMCDCAGPRLQSERLTPLSNSLLILLFY